MSLLVNSQEYSLQVPHQPLPDVRPSDFFTEDEYGHRIFHAQGKVLDAIRFSKRPLSGVGTCHELAVGTDVFEEALEKLTDFADRYDDRRAKKVRSQRHREAQFGLGPYEHRLRSPQHIARRRALLFSGADIPLDYFDDELSQPTVDAFVQRMRWQLVHEAAEDLFYGNALELVGGIWLVRVSAMDNHRLGLKPHESVSVKNDNRSWHGRPRRDRLRDLAP